MNWLLLAVLGILIIYIYHGYRKGFLKAVFSLVSLFVVLAASTVLSPYVSKALIHNQNLNNWVTEKMEEIITLPKKEQTVSEQVEQVEKLNLPDSIKKAIIENNNNDVYKALAVQNFNEYLSRYFACLIINAMGFLLTFFVLRIVLLIVFQALDIISRFPVINGLNKTAGLFIGIFEGLLVIWIFCIIITMFSTTVFGKQIFAMIGESRFLTSVYNNNLLLRVVTNMAKVLF